MRLLTEGKEDCALPLQDTVFVAAQQQVYPVPMQIPDGRLSSLGVVGSVDGNQQLLFILRADIGAQVVVDRQRHEGSFGQKGIDSRS